MALIKTNTRSLSGALSANQVPTQTITSANLPAGTVLQIQHHHKETATSYSAGIQTGIVGMASGVTVADENCERIKLSRSLYGMGMKVAAISMLCQDARVFDAMMSAGTPCPYEGKIGDEAKQQWTLNPNKIPSESIHFKKKVKKKITINSRGQ